MSFCGDKRRKGAGEEAEKEAMVVTAKEEGAE